MKVKRQRRGKAHYFAICGGGSVLRLHVTLQESKGGSFIKIMLTPAMFGTLYRNLRPAYKQAQLLCGFRNAQTTWRSAATFTLQEDCLGELTSCNPVITFMCYFTLLTLVWIFIDQCSTMEAHRCILTTCGFGITVALLLHTTPRLIRETWTLQV